MFDILPTDNIKIKTAFNYIDDGYQRLRNAGVITTQDKELLDSFVINIKSLFTNIMQQITIFNQERPIDLYFYSRLFDTDDGNLRMTLLISDDPFFSLFSLVKNSLNDINQLNEMYAQADTKKMLELEEDSIYKSILFNLRLFFHETENLICKGYSIKLHDNEKRIKADVRTMMMINTIIEELTSDYQKYLQKSLKTTMLQSAYYSSMSNSYEALINYFRYCESEVNNRFEFIDTNQRTDEDFYSYKTSENEKNFPPSLISKSLIKTEFDAPAIYRPSICSVQNEEYVAMSFPFKYLVLFFLGGIFVIFVMLIKKRN